MVIILWFVFAAVVAFVAYWLGRGVRLNRVIRDEPERVLYDPASGEILEPDTEEWRRAMRQGNVVSFIP
jgi:hypothetical protein